MPQNVDFWDQLYFDLYYFSRQLFDKTEENNSALDNNRDIVGS